MKRVEIIINQTVNEIENVEEPNLILVFLKSFFGTIAVLLTLIYLIFFV